MPEHSNKAAKEAHLLDCGSKRLATPLSRGKALSGATRKTSNRLAGALRLAAFGLEMAKYRLGEYCRRMKGRLGKAEGITATAHKLVRAIHAMIASGRG